MLHSLDDLMKSRLQVTDRKVPVDEVFFDPTDRRVRYLAVNIGGWFDVTEVIVSADLLDPPATDADDWVLRIDEASLESAPRWTEYMEREAVDMTNWPPVIVGPFGGTYAPMLLYEQLVASQRPDSEPAPEPEGAGKGDGEVYRMERATEWIGLPAFGKDGELGVVEDILFDGETLALDTLVLGSGGLFSHRSGEVPIASVRHMTRQGTHLVLDITAAEVRRPEE